MTLVYCVVDARIVNPKSVLDSRHLLMERSLSMKLSKLIMLSAALLLQQSSAFAIGSESIVKRSETGLTNAWKIDPAHTSAHFTVKHMMVSNVRGDFSKVSGTANYDGKNFDNSSVLAVIDASTVNTNEPNRDQHLKSADFFDVAKYPTISFKSTSVESQPNGFKIIGDLTIHGITKTVTLEAESLPPAIKDPYGNLRTGTEARTKINRKDFGLAFDKMLDNGGALVGDDVDITIDVELIQKPATADSKSTL